jgi:Uma2 family endonuclease
MTPVAAGQEPARKVLFNGRACERFLVEGVSWASYESLLRDFRERGPRMTYDRGRLEFMMPLHPHESYGHLIGRLIEMFAFEMNIPIHGGRSTTLRRELAQRGLEPDESYWIQNEPRMRGKKELDLETDPPPDLAIEIDITSSSLPRMSIYASLGVAEVWRFDGSTLTFHGLEAAQQYVSLERSRGFPALTPERVLQFLAQSDRLSEHELMAALIDWVRREVKPKKKGAPRSRPPRRNGPRKK